MTEREKMLSGKPYNAVEEDLIRDLNATKDKIWEYNNLKPSLRDERQKLLRELLGKTGENFLILQPFYCDYGKNIEIGENFFSNFNFTVLDEAKVTIGAHAYIGPNVSIYTACHPLEPEERNKQIEWAEPVTIGDNVWIGGSATILPGVTIGNNVVIGAGSVVTHDIPHNCVAVGNPARVIKHINI